MVKKGNKLQCSSQKYTEDEYYTSLQGLHIFDTILRAAELRLFKRKQKSDNVICDKVTSIFYLLSL